jgi:hypothetical protein
VRTSLAALLFALLPVVAAKAGLDASHSVQYSAVLVLPIWTGMWVYAAIDTRRIFREDERARPDIPVVGAIFSVNVSGSVLSAIVAFDLAPGVAEALYLTAVLCPVATAALLLSNVLGTLAFRGNDPPAA